jgi:ATP-dependent Clp protease ATP-binding subunit ClpA
MNRIDKIVVFRPLHQPELEAVLDIELDLVQRRVLETARGQFVFRVTKDARGHLLREGTDVRYGARHLKRAIERNVVYPMANLLATDQVHPGDVLCVDWDPCRGELIFQRESEGAMIPVAVPRPEAQGQAQAASAGGGKQVE